MFDKIKIMMFVLMAVFILSTVPARAEVGIKVNDDSVGIATDLNIKTPDSVTNDGSTFEINVVGKDMVAAGVANGGATSMTSSENAIPVGYSHVRMALSSTVGQVKTLANGKKGQILVIHVTAVAGSGTAVITPTTKTGFASLTLNAVDDQAVLLYIDDTSGWITLPGTSVTINH